MKNVMQFEGGYKAVITYDPEIEMFRGEFVGQDRRSMEQFGSLALDAIQVAAKSRGVVLRPGAVGGGV